MSRYINADVFLKSVKQKAYPQSGSVNESERKISLFGIMEILTAMPTADVVEVVHGKWIMLNPSLAKCSVCGGYESTNGKDKTGKGVIFKMQKKFCPHCGAKMGGAV